LYRVFGISIDLLYIVFWAIVDVIKLLALGAPLALFVLYIPTFAQEVEPPTTLTNTTRDDPQLNANDRQEPELERLSEKHIYRVLFRWPQTTLNEQGA